MSTKHKTPGRGLVALGAAAVLIFAAGVIGRNVGLQQLQAVLTEETGDRQELQPFDLSAYTLFKAENAITHFTLENGELTGRTITETAVLPENAQLPESFSSETTLAVRPEDREEINRSAVFAGSGSASETHDFLVMRDIYLPDNTSLRLYMTEYQSEEPRPVSAYLNMWSGMDWELAESVPEEYSMWRDESAVQWNGSWFLNLGGKNLRYEPGVWQVTESLTEEERDALPRDGSVQYGDSTVPVLCKSTEYGSVELFYQPQNVVSVLNLAQMGQYLGVLYLDTNGDVWFDLVDENARCVQQVFIRESGEETLYAITVNTQKADQACFVLRQQESYTTVQIALFQVREDGSLNVVSLPGEAKEEGKLAGTVVVQLSPDGQKLLSVGSEETAVQLDSTPWETEPVTYYSGYRLNVYDLSRQTVTYSGKLDTGREMTWGRYLSSSDFIYYGLAGELMSMNRDCYTVFPQQTQEG